MDPASDPLADLEFCQVRDATGTPLGLLEQIYRDAETREPAWAQILGGFQHMRRMIVPLRQDDVDGVIPQSPHTPGGATPGPSGELQVGVTTAAALAAPILDATDGISAAEAEALREHYRLYHP